MRYINPVIFLSVLLFSCSKQQDSTDIEVIGHAGMGLEMSNSIYHDNSLEAIEFALKMQGSDGVEIDVQQDEDGVLWLFHNDNLYKETNSFDCIALRSTKDLNNVYYSSVHQEKLIKLSDVDFSLYPNQKIFLDLRLWRGCLQDYINPLTLKNALLDLNIHQFENIYLIVPSASYLPVFNAEFNVLFANDDYSYALNILNQDSLVQGLVIRNQNINSSQVEHIKAMNKSIFLFEMRSPKGIKSGLAKRPTGIISDDLRAAIIQRRKL